MGAHANCFVVILSAAIVIACRTASPAVDHEPCTQTPTDGARSFLLDHREPGIWLSNTGLCHGILGCNVGTTNGNVARLDNVMPGGHARGEKMVLGLVPNAEYDVTVWGYTDGTMGSPLNQMTVEVGDLRLTIDQSAGVRHLFEGAGRSRTDSQGVLFLTFAATDGPGGDGVAFGHGNIHEIEGEMVRPNRD